MATLRLHFDDAGEWPSGKAHGFGPCIRGFESLLPSQPLEYDLASYCRGCF